MRPLPACTMLIDLLMREGSWEGTEPRLEQVWARVGSSALSDSLCYKVADPRASFQMSSGAQSVPKSPGKSCLVEKCFPWEHKFTFASIPRIL